MIRASSLGAVLSKVVNHTDFTCTATLTVQGRADESSHIICSPALIYCTVHSYAES